MVSRGPACPGQSGYNKRLRKLAHTIAWLIGVLGADTSVGDDDLWVVDSTPLECARSTEGQTLGSGRLGPVRLLRLALPLLLGSAAASAVHLVHGLPLGWALTGAKADERDVLIEILSTTTTLVSNTRESVTIIGDKKPLRPSAAPITDPSRAITGEPELPPIMSLLVMKSQGRIHLFLAAFGRPARRQGGTAVGRWPVRRGRDAGEGRNLAAVLVPPGTVP